MKITVQTYDATLGRMYQVDPMAAKYASLTPYNYSFNNPTAFSDVSGADPNETVNYSAMNGQYHTAYTYDDKINYHSTAVWYDAMGWRNEVPGGYGSYAWATGAGGSMGRYWHAGDGRMFWSGYESYARGLRNDADMVRYGEMTVQQYGQRNGISISTEQLRYMAYAHNVLGINPITGVRYQFNTPIPPHLPTKGISFVALGMLPSQGTGSIEKLSVTVYDPKDFDQVMGIALQLQYNPTADEKRKYKKFNWLLTVSSNRLVNYTPEWVGEYHNVPWKDGKPTFYSDFEENALWFGYNALADSKPVNSWFTGYVSALGYADGTWHVLDSVNFGWTYFDGGMKVNYPSRGFIPQWHFESLTNKDLW